MIDRIVIDNFATIEHISFDLGRGLNIITGETGAGKSVLVTAVSTVLGARADTSMVRTGAEKALIQLAGEKDGEEVILTREILPSGKSWSRINGELVTLGEVRKFCSGWVDIHGQYDNQQILDPSNHIHITDRYHSEAIRPELDRLAELHSSYSEVKRELDELIRTENAALRQQDYYRFELDHIRSLSLRPGEEEELRSQLSLIKNSSRIFSAVRSSYEALHEADVSVLSSLGDIVNELDTVRSFSDTLDSAASRAADAYYSLEDVSDTLRQISESLDYSDEDLDRISERLASIEDARRKYRMTVEEILAYADELSAKLSVIENFDAERTRLEAEVSRARTALEDQASHVSEIRHIIAARLSSAMMNELADLDFPNSEFSIRIDRLDDISPLGFDDVEFMISTNPGEPLMPLARIASGGEISRIMLAFKHIIGESDSVDSMIFDEIDTGISGRTALTVGRKMKELASHRQIVSVTHLPQIAAYGDDNYLISKTISDGKSHTDIDHLDNEGKAAMIATLFSGSADSGNALEAARELITLASK